MYYSHISAILLLKCYVLIVLMAIIVFIIFNYRGYAWLWLVMIDYDWSRLWCYQYQYSEKEECIEYHEGSWHGELVGPIDSDCSPTICQCYQHKWMTVSTCCNVFCDHNALSYTESCHIVYSC